MSRNNTQALLSLLREAIDYEAPSFDAPDDEEHPVNGGNTVDWLAEWRQRARAAYIKALPPGVRRSYLKTLTPTARELLEELEHS